MDCKKEKERHHHDLWIPQGKKSFGSLLIYRKKHTTAALIEFAIRVDELQGVVDPVPVQEFLR